MSFLIKYIKRKIKKHMQNFEVNVDKAIKRWAPVLDQLKVTDPEKREWMSVYAETHQINENVSYSTLGNLQGMGPVSAPVVGLTPGSVWQAGSGAQGSGDIAQNLLPVSMKIAAQTIGLDLVAVKPASSPRIELLFVDFKYGNENNVWGEQDERPIVFKVNNNDNGSLKTALLASMTSNGVKELIGGLSSRMWFQLSGQTLTDGISTSNTAGYYGQGTTPSITTPLTEPTAKEGWLEFLGFSRVDGLPMFRTYRQTAAPSANFVYINNKNTFPQYSNTYTINLQSILQLGSNLVVNFSTGPVTTPLWTGATIELVSLLEDQIPGFVAGWNTTNGMTRDTDESTYPGVIGPDIFTKAIQVGDIEISSL